MQEEATRVLIVDDQVLYREGLRELMSHWPEFKVIGEASNGAEAVQFCEEHIPDMVLMDVKMPVMGGLEAVGRIAKSHPSITVIMLTVEIEDRSLFGALYNGAKGYILKDMPSRQLRNRLRGAVQGEAALSGTAATRIIEKLVRQPVTGADAFTRAPDNRGLSEREVQIFRLVALGLSNEEIGAQLYLSSGTVKKQLRSLMQKFNLENRVQMAVYAIRTGLAD